MRVQNASQEQLHHESSRAENVPQSRPNLHPGHPLPMRNCSTRCYPWVLVWVHAYSHIQPANIHQKFPRWFVLSSVLCRREAAGDSGSSLRPASLAPQGSLGGRYVRFSVMSDSFWPMDCCSPGSYVQLRFSLLLKRRVWMFSCRFLIPVCWLYSEGIAFEKHPLFCWLAGCWRVMWVGV